MADLYTSTAQGWSGLEIVAVRHTMMATPSTKTYVSQIAGVQGKNMEKRFVRDGLIPLGAGQDELFAAAKKPWIFDEYSDLG